MITNREKTPQKRWWFWMIWYVPAGRSEYQYVGAGPYQMFDADAYHTEFRTRSQYLTPYIYRWVWDPAQGWKQDTRSDMEWLRVMAK